MAVVEISDVNELQAIENALDGDYIQVNNIDMVSAASWDNGAGWLGIGSETDRFIGHYDGNGYTCSNLYMNRPSEWRRTGLWGYIGEDGLVERLGVIDAEVTAEAPSLFLSSNSGTVRQCYATGESISSYDPAQFVYGFCWGNGELIEDSYTIVTMAADKSIWGFAHNVGGTLTRCWSASDITVSGDPDNWYGFASGGTANDCFWDKDRVNFDPEDQGSAARGTGKTTAEMQDIDTYTPEWSIVVVPDLETKDTSEIWNIVDGESYPFFSYTPPNSHGSIQAIATLVGRGFRPSVITAGNVQSIATIHGEGFGGPAGLLARGYGSITVVGSLAGSGYKQPKAKPTISSIAQLAPVGYRASRASGFTFAIARLRANSKLFEIWNQAQLEAVANAPNENYRVMRDIIVSDFTTIPSFTGHLAGNRFSIVSLDVPLIDVNEGVIDLLCIRHGSGAMSLVNENNGTIRRCCGRNYESNTSFIESNTGTVQKTFTRDLLISGVDKLGGLIGESQNGTIEHCYSLDCEIIGNDAIGGLVGQSENDTFVWVYASNELTGDTHVGGVVGAVISDSDNELGEKDTQRGQYHTWNGSGTEPGTVGIADSDGQVWYLFVNTDGILRIHNAVPTSNTDGTIVGTQI